MCALSSVAIINMSFKFFALRQIHNIAVFVSAIGFVRHIRAAANSGAVYSVYSVTIFIATILARVIVGRTRKNEKHGKQKAGSQNEKMDSFHNKFNLANPSRNAPSTSNHP
jgi:hypothetical protein